jgi:hypothetical protein
MWKGGCYPDPQPPLDGVLDAGCRPHVLVVYVIGRISTHVNTAYDDEITQVARLTGARPRRPSEAP